MQIRKERDALQLQVHSLKVQLRDFTTAKEAQAESAVLLRLQKLEALIGSLKLGSQAHALPPANSEALDTDASVRQVRKDEEAREQGVDDDMCRFCRKNGPNENCDLCWI